MTALPNPFFNSTLASAMTVGSTTAPDLPSHPVAVVANSQFTPPTDFEGDASPMSVNGLASSGLRQKRDNREIRSPRGPASIPEPAPMAPATPSPGVETSADAGLPSASAAFSNLLHKLNTINNPCDLDALAKNLEKIDRNDPPPDRELLTFLEGEPPIYWPMIERKPQPKFLRRIFELAGMPT